jgi:hypothetical protein
MARPTPADYAPLYHNYVQLAEGDDVIAALNQSWDRLGFWLSQVPEEKMNYAYAPGKWTVAQMFQHIIDSERVFAYRAMSIARGEQQPLPGFDENSYAALADAEHRTFIGLKEEMLTLRKSTIQLFNSFRVHELNRAGVAFGSRITVNALGFILAGHVYHHQRVFAERY